MTALAHVTLTAAPSSTLRFLIGKVSPSACVLPETARLLPERCTLLSDAFALGRTLFDTHASGLRGMEGKEVRIKPLLLPDLTSVLLTGASVASSKGTKPGPGAECLLGLGVGFCCCLADSGRDGLGAANLGACIAFGGILSTDLVRVICTALLPILSSQLVTSHMSHAADTTQPALSGNVKGERMSLTNARRWLRSCEVTLTAGAD